MTQLHEDSQWGARRPYPAPHRWPGPTARPPGHQRPRGAMPVGSARAAVRYVYTGTRPKGCGDAVAVTARPPRTPTGRRRGRGAGPSAPIAVRGTGSPRRRRRRRKRSQRCRSRSGGCGRHGRRADRRRSTSRSRRLRRTTRRAAEPPRRAQAMDASNAAVHTRSDGRPRGCRPHSSGAGPMRRVTRSYMSGTGASDGRCRSECSRRASTRNVPGGAHDRARAAHAASHPNPNRPLTNQQFRTGRRTDSRNA